MPTVIRDWLGRRPEELAWGAASSVFVDEAKLLPDYMPPTIPHREEELRELIYLFRPLVQSPERVSQQVLITGPVGVGKTLVAKKLGGHVEPKALSHGKHVKYLHVNCRIDRSLTGILVKALSALGRGFPTRGFSISELIQFFINTLQEEGVHMIIAFDEVDALIRREGADTLYAITRLREVTEGVQVFSSILISKTLDYLWEQIPAPSAPSKRT